MKTRRGTNGKFLSTGQGIENIPNSDIVTPFEKEEGHNPVTSRQNYTITARGNGTSIQIPIPIPQGGWNIMKVILCLLLFSPWIYLIFRKQNREIMTQKVSDFFEENFVCRPCPPCMMNETISNKTEENPKKNGL
jgi:hypothetical protein